MSNSVSTSLADPGAVILSLGTPTQPSACGVADGSITLSGLVVGNTYLLRYKKNGIWQSSSTVVASSSSYTILGLGAGSLYKYYRNTRRMYIKFSKVKFLLTLEQRNCH